VRDRLILAAIGIVAIPGLVLWGVFSPSSKAQPAAASRSSQAPAPTPTPSPQATVKWHSIFNATFPVGSKLDTSKWGTCYPWADAKVGCTNFANHELQWYVRSQVHVANGALNLVARARPIQGRSQSGAPKTYPCRSGMVTTFPSLKFEYGYIKVWAKIPAGVGLWPALWLAAANEKWPPEMDLMEHWGTINQTAVFFHPIGSGQVAQKLTGNFTTGWHTFALNWTPTKMEFIVDKHVVLRVTHRIPHQKMYFIANVAYNGSGEPKVCRGTMQIKHVQVWQRAN